MNISQYIHCISFDTRSREATRNDPITPGAFEAQVLLLAISLLWFNETMTAAACFVMFFTGQAVETVSSSSLALPLLVEPPFV